VINANNLFGDRFLDTKTLYLYCFNGLPSLSYIGQINGEKAFEVFKENFKDLIDYVHQYRWYKKKTKEYQFDTTVIVMKNNCLVEFDEGYCEVLHDGRQQGFLNELTNIVSQFKQKERRQPLEINVIVQDRNKLHLKAMEIKRTKLDLGLFYEDDFRETDELIRRRLNKKRR
jgi:hypothetical protein